MCNVKLSHHSVTAIITLCVRIREHEQTRHASQWLTSAKHITQMSKKLHRCKPEEVSMLAWLIKMLPPNTLWQYVIQDLHIARRQLEQQDRLLREDTRPGSASCSAARITYGPKRRVTAEGLQAEDKVGGRLDKCMDKTMQNDARLKRPRLTLPTATEQHGRQHVRNRMHIAEPVDPCQEMSGSRNRLPQQDGYTEKTESAEDTDGMEGQRNAGGEQPKHRKGKPIVTHKQRRKRKRTRDGRQQD